MVINVPNNYTPLFLLYKLILVSFENNHYIVKRSLFHFHISNASSSQSPFPFVGLLDIQYESLHSNYELLLSNDQLHLVALSFVQIKQINDLYILHEMLAISGLPKIPPTCGIHFTISSNSSFSLFFSPTIAVIPSIS